MYLFIQLLVTSLTSLVDQTLSLCFTQHKESGYSWWAIVCFMVGGYFVWAFKPIGSVLFFCWMQRIHRRGNPSLQYNGQYSEMQYWEDAQGGASLACPLHDNTIKYAEKNCYAKARTRQKMTIYNSCMELGICPIGTICEQHSPHKRWLRFYQIKDFSVTL